MSTQEIYFRSLIVILGIAIVAGAFIVQTAIILQVLEIIGGLLLTVLTLIKRFKPWH